MPSPEIEDILQLINNRENKEVDFKLELDLSRDRLKKGLAEDVVSFANTKGGIIIVGVEDETRHIRGIPTPLDHDRIVQSITDLTEPPVDFSVDTIEINGKLVGLIKIPCGKAVYCLRRERRVVIRRDGIKSTGTPAEIAQLSEERDYSARVYLCEPNTFLSFDDRAVMLSGEVQQYRKIAKRGKLAHLAECPLFLPEYSRWIAAPQFGDTKGSLMVHYYDPSYIKHSDFISQVAEVENQLGLLARYLDFGFQAAINWSISSHGFLCYGRGSQTLLQALEQGELGVISIAACGEFRGSTERRSFLLLICGYCKSRKQDVTFVHDREMRLYLSTLPVSNAWVRTLFSPFLNEEEMPFSLLSYELVHPRLRVWRPGVRSLPVVPIRGVIGRYNYQSGDNAGISAAIADTKWFDPRVYKVGTLWPGGSASWGRDIPSMIYEPIDRDPEIKSCPISLLNECVVSLTNPIASYDEIESREVKGFHLPFIKHLEVKVIGHTVHVLGCVP